MSSRKLVNLSMNRVEGDLEVKLRIEDRTVVDAWSSGTLYRGFETILVGRKPTDSLVITPRICGICSTTHLLAAVQALDRIAGVVPPDNALRLRNAALMIEHAQNDVRQAVLMFLVDFTNPRYRDHPLFDEAERRYRPLVGESCREVLRETRKILEVFALIAGQWPHSSFMVPGGVTFRPHASEVLQCRLLLRRYREWYERRILGCSLERWDAVAGEADLDTWLAEVAEAPADGEGAIYRPCDPIVHGEGHGLIQAARGALGHWVCVENGRIARYQIVTPTAWNGSPRDSLDRRGPWEEALIGTPVAEDGNPVEAGHVIRSFDPCLVCAVH